jgi:uncharacterized protein (DUF433 family)
MSEGLIMPDSATMKNTVFRRLITLDFILENMADGKTIEQILETHPCLTREAIHEALAFAAEAVRTDVSYSIIAGTGITVKFILEKLASGKTVEQLLKVHPRLTRELVQEALAFAAEDLRTDVIYPLGGQCH